MKFEYRRVLLNAGLTIQGGRTPNPGGVGNQPGRRRYSVTGQVAFPGVEDEVEQMFNGLGAEGWVLQTAVNLDSGAESGECPAVNLIEYIFRRQVPG